MFQSQMKAVFRLLAEQLSLIRKEITRLKSAVDEENRQEEKD